MLKMLAATAIVLTIAVSSVFSQTTQTASSTTPVSNPELAPAIKLLSQDEVKKALDLLKKAVKKNDADGEAWYYIGVAYLRQNDFKKGAEAFNKAIQRRPDLAASTHAAFAYALVLRNRLDQALISANMALGRDSQNIEALYTLGIVDLRRGARQEAIQKADKIIALKPDFAAAYLLKSQAFVSAGNAFNPAAESNDERKSRYRLAVQALEKYLQLETDPRVAESWKTQLENLKFHSGDAGNIYIGRDVTTKVKLISKPEPVYTAAARNEQVVGTVVLKCVFASDGTVKHILVVRALPGGLTERAIEAAKKIKFHPAMRDGQPVSMWMQLEYNFNLH